MLNYNKLSICDFLFFIGLVFKFLVVYAVLKKMFQLKKY